MHMCSERRWGGAECTCGHSVHEVTAQMGGAELLDPGAARAAAGGGD